VSLDSRAIEARDRLAALLASVTGGAE